MPRSAVTDEKQSPAERLDDHARTVATLLIEQIENGMAPWQKPWEDSRISLPTNASTGKAYRGSNLLYLWDVGIHEGYTDPRWMTFNQARDLNASVNKNEHGRKIMYAVTHYEINKKNANGRPVIGADGQPEKVYVEYDSPRMKYYTVFNAQQMTGLAPRELTIEHVWDQHERCEDLLRKSGAKIYHAGNRAYYTPVLDSITLPPKSQFPAADRYYATALHELGHWTGHPSRLDREMSGGFGSESYAREELRAEISSLMVGAELDLGHDPGQHTAYVAHWLRILRDDSKEILRACADASKIQEHILGFEKSKEIEQIREKMVEHAGVHALPLAPTIHVAAMGIPSGKNHRVSFDPKTGGYVQHADQGLILTYGFDQPVLEIRSNEGVLNVTLGGRDDAWLDLTTALNRGDLFQADLVGQLGALDGERQATMVHVVVGRQADGQIVVGMRPMDGEQTRVVLDPDMAHHLSLAMLRSTDMGRRLGVSHALRTTFQDHARENDHELSR